MNLILAALVPLAYATFLAPSAFAGEAYPATLSGTSTLQAIAPKPPEATAKPRTSETLTVHVVPPPQFADDSEEAEQRSLETCGARWDSKLKAYREELAQAKGYRTYFETWKDSPAQRPPLLPLPVLTRTSYRQCMAQCLEAAGAICPGGWPDEK
jgi:hypothetical protein